MPLLELPSPYVMLHVAPESLADVLLLLGLYTVWPLTWLLGVELLKTHKSDEPVSKSRLSVCAGVPICTGVT